MPFDFDRIAVGDALPGLPVTPTLADAVMYAAAMWEFQRIHFDDAWARERENLPGAILQGPALGNYLVRCITAWAGAAVRLQALEWRNHGIAPLGETLTCTGQVSERTGEALRCELAIVNPRGQAIVSATATVEAAR